MRQFASLSLFKQSIKLGHYQCEFNLVHDTENKHNSITTRRMIASKDAIMLFIACKFVYCDTQSVEIVSLVLSLSEIDNWHLIIQ